MSTHSKAWLLLAAIAAGISIAHAEGISPSSFGSSVFGGIGTFGKTTSGTAPTGCGTGVIDASAGCPLPMLGS